MIWELVVAQKKARHTEAFSLPTHTPVPSQLRLCPPSCSSSSPSDQQPPRTTGLPAVVPVRPTVPRPHQLVLLHPSLPGHRLGVPGPLPLVRRCLLGSDPPCSAPGAEVSAWLRSTLLCPTCCSFSGTPGENQQERALDFHSLGEAGVTAAQHLLSPPPCTLWKATSVLRPRHQLTHSLTLVDDAY